MLYSFLHDSQLLLCHCMKDIIVWHFIDLMRTLNTFHASPLYFISTHWKVNSIQPHWGYLSYPKSMLAWRALSHNCSDKALCFPLLRLLPHPQLRAPLSSFSLSLYEQIFFFFKTGDPYNGCFKSDNSSPEPNDRQKTLRWKSGEQVYNQFETPLGKVSKASTKNVLREIVKWDKEKAFL